MVATEYIPLIWRYHTKEKTKQTASKKYARKNI